MAPEIVQETIGAERDVETGNVHVGRKRENVPYFAIDLLAGEIDKDLLYEEFVRVSKLKYAKFITVEQGGEIKIYLFRQTSGYMHKDFYEDTKGDLLDAGYVWDNPEGLQIEKRFSSSLIGQGLALSELQAQNNREHLTEKYDQAGLLLES